MARSQMKVRKGMAGDNPKGPAVDLHQTQGSKPKPMTAGTAAPVETWKK